MLVLKAFWVCFIFDEDRVVVKSGTLEAIDGSKLTEEPVDPTAAAVVDILMSEFKILDDLDCWLLNLLAFGSAVTLVDMILFGRSLLNVGTVSSNLSLSVEIYWLIPEGIALDSDEVSDDGEVEEEEEDEVVDEDSEEPVFESEDELEVEDDAELVCETEVEEDAFEADFENETTEDKQDDVSSLIWLITSSILFKLMPLLGDLKWLLLVLAMQSVE